MHLFSLLFLWFHAALAQDQWRLIHRDGSVETSTGTPRLAREQKAELNTAWVWNGFRAPRRVAPERIGEERLPEDSSRLAVRVARRAGGPAPEDLRLIAAPVEMWMEVAEASLPSWPVPKGGAILIPRDSGRPWRLRVAGKGEGSWWLNVPPGQKTAVLTSAPAAGIAVAVLDPQGRPVRTLNGSLQEPIGRGGRIAGWATQHGGDSGTLTVPGLPDEGEVSLTLMTGSAAPLVLRGRPSTLPHQVRLAAGAELVGRLVDSKGAPLADVAVEAEAWSSNELPQVMTAKGRSGSDGEWHLRGLPAGQIAWNARARGFVPLMETFDVAVGERQDLGTRTLQHGTTLAVHVANESGDPIPGAQLHIDAGRLLATADAAGIARFEGLATAPVEVKGSADGYLGGSARFHVPFPEDARLVLRRAFVVRGRLVSASGNPVLRGSARLDSASCQNEVPLRDGGRFQFDLPPLSDAAELVLRSPSTQELRLHLATGQGGETRDLGDLTAPSGLVVTGRVVRADDGSPIAGARVWTPRQGPAGPAVAWATRDILDAVAGVDGRFELSGLLAAPALLNFEAAGLARTQVPVPLDQQPGASESGVVDLGTIALSQGTTLLVRVATRDREAKGAVARADLGNRWSESDMLTAQVWNGEALIPGVPPGTVTISVLADRRLLCEQSVVVLEGGEQTVDCRSKALRVAGIVQVGGVPAGTGSLSWSAPDLSMPSRIDTVVSPGGLKQFQIVGAGRPGVSVAIASDGSFETEDLSPGRWLVIWLSQGSASGEQIVDIPAGEHFETILSFPGLAVTGTVVDRAGQPVERARVRELAGGGIAFSDREGRFSLVGLKPGKSVIQAQLQDQTSPLAELNLRIGETAEPLRLVLGERKVPSLTVRIVDAGGAPIPGAFVFVDEEGKGQRLVVADAQGKAEIRLEPPLAPRVRAAAFSAGSWGFGDWLDGPIAEAGLRVEVAGAESFVVTSETHRGSPRILTSNGWDVSWLLRLLGAPPMLAPDRPLQMSGLVAGRYSVSLDGASITLDVARQRTVEGRMQ